MPDINEAASQPAETQTSDGGRGNNVTVDQFAAMLQRGKIPETETETGAATSDETENPQDSAQIAESEQTQPTPEEQPAETQDPEDETAEEGESEVLSQDKEALPPELQKAIDKRIGKEVARRKALEDEKKALASELEQLKAAQAQQPEQPQAPVVVNTPDQPLAHISTVQDLQREHQQAKSITQVAEDLLDQFEPGVEKVMYGDREYTKAEVKTIYRNAKRTVEEFIPQRHQFLQAKQMWRAKALTDFPFLKDKTSAEYQMAQTAIRNYPWIEGAPDSDYIVGLAVKGQMALEAEKKAKAAPVKPVAKAPASQVATVATSSSKPRGGENVVLRQKAAKEISAIQSKKNLTTEDYATVLLKRQQLSTTR